MGANGEHSSRLRNFEGFKLVTNLKETKEAKSPMEPPPSYDEALGMVAGPGQRSQRYSPTYEPAREGKTFNVVPGATDTSVIHEEGNLTRKHEWETTLKKAVNREWEKVYAVLDGPSLSCYKDEKHAKRTSSSRLHHEPIMNLTNAVCEYATDYTKRPYVFRLKLPSGAEYLFMSKDQADMEQWINCINSACSRADSTKQGT